MPKCLVSCQITGALLRRWAALALKTPKVFLDLADITCILLKQTEDTTMKTNTYKDLNIPEDLMTLPHSHDMVELGLKLNATPYMHRCALRLLRVLINQGMKPDQAYANASGFMSDCSGITEDDIRPVLAEQRRSFWMRMAIASLFLVLAFVVADRASAEDRHYATVKNWQVDAVDNGSCVAYSDFEENNGLGFVVRPNGSVILIVAREGWNIQPGTYKGVEIQVDSRDGWGGSATVVEGTSSAFGLAIKPELLYEIAKGQSLYVKAGTWLAMFDLTASNKAIAKTVECAKGVSSSPFVAPKTSNPFGDDGFPDGLPITDFKPTNPEFPVDPNGNKLDL